MERLTYIDNLKGILILLVILGHCIQFTDIDFDHNIIFRYIYAFHMPLFICISGFVSYKPQIRWETVRKRFLQLMVPFAIWSLIHACIYRDLSVFTNTIIHPDTGVWFLWTLFFIVLILYVCDKIAKYSNIKLEFLSIIMAVVLITTMIVSKLKIFGFQFVAWYFPFYIMGFYWRKYQQKIHIQQDVLILLNVSFFFMAYWWMRKEPPTFLPINSPIMYNYLYKSIVAIIAIVAFIPTSYHYLNYNIPVINRMGGATLGLYVIHQPVIDLLIKYFVNGNRIWTYWLFVFVLWLFTTFISYWLYLLIQRNRYLSMLLLGK